MNGRSATPGSSAIEALITVAQHDARAVRVLSPRPANLFQMGPADRDQLVQGSSHLRDALETAVAAALPQVWLTAMREALLQTLMRAGEALALAGDSRLNSILQQALEVAADMPSTVALPRTRYECGRMQLRTHNARLDTLLRLADSWVAAARIEEDPLEAHEAEACAASEHVAIGDAQGALRLVAEARRSRSRAIGVVLPTLVDLAGIPMDAVAQSAAVQGWLPMLERLRSFELFLTWTEAEAELLEGHAERAAALRTETVPDAYVAHVGEAIECNVAEALLAAGRASEAKATLDRLVARFDGDAHLQPHRSAIHLLLGMAASRLGDRSAADRHLRTAREAIAEYPNPEIEWELWDEQARQLEGAGEHAQALAAAEAGIAVIGLLRRAPLNHELDSLWLSDKMRLVRMAVSLAAHLGDGRAVSKIVDAVKSRALSAILQAGPADGAPQPLPDEFLALDAELDALEIELLAARRSTPPGATNAQATSAGQPTSRARRLRTLLTRRSELVDRLRLHDPRWHLISEPASIDIDAILAKLDAVGQHALQLFDDGGGITAVLLGGGTVRVDHQPVRASTRAAIAAYQASLVRASPAPAFADISTATGLQADDLVSSSLLSSAIDAESLVVIPHASLHTLPWPALRFGNRRLLHYTAVGVLPNLASLAALCDRAIGRPRRVDLVAVPDAPGLPRLEHVNGEVTALISAYRGAGGVANALIGPAATRAALLGLMTASRGRDEVIHIAAHGAADAHYPSLSGIMTADGRVDAAEIAAQRIEADEVVLSACSTGWRPTHLNGSPLYGDDILGLPGAFLEAGARSLLVSIPKAYDEATSQFMVAYHVERMAGARPLRALRSAQLAAAADDGMPAYVWAGFVIYGCS